MNLVRLLIGLFGKKPTWVIDVDQQQSYDDNDNMKDRKIIFKVSRWNKLGLYYNDIADFDTLSEAHDFLSKYKNFPLNGDGVY